MAIGGAERTSISNPIKRPPFQKYVPIFRLVTLKILVKSIGKGTKAANFFSSKIVFIDVVI